MDGQHNTGDGSSGRSGALLQISYFKDQLAVNNILLSYFLGLGETTNSQDRFPAIQYLSGPEAPEIYLTVK